MVIVDGGCGVLMVVQDVLENGLDFWCGDQFEIVIFEKLYEVYVVIEDRVEGFILFSKIVMCYSGIEVVVCVEVVFNDVLCVVYQDGFDGKIFLLCWFFVYFRLVLVFCYYFEYVWFVEEFVDYLMMFGGISMVVKEYQCVLDFCIDLIDLNFDWVLEEEIIQNKLKLVKVFVVGG